MSENKNHYVDVEELRKHLREHYDSGCEIALENFLNACYEIGIRVAGDKRYLVDHDAVDDAVSHAMIGIVRAIREKRIDPAQKLFGFLTSHFKFRSIDYIRKLYRENDRIDYADYLEHLKSTDLAAYERQMQEIEMDALEMSDEDDDLV